MQVSGQKRSRPFSTEGESESKRARPMTRSQSAVQKSWQELAQETTYSTLLSQSGNQRLFVALEANESSLFFKNDGLKQIAKLQSALLPAKSFGRHPGTWNTYESRETGIFLTMVSHQGTGLLSDTYNDRAFHSHFHFKDKTIRCFGVIDGYKDAAVAEKVANLLPLVFHNTLKEVEGKRQHTDLLIDLALSNSTVVVNEIIRKHFSACKDSGASVVAAVQYGDQLFVANCGLTSAILIEGGKAIPLSCDHKASDTLAAKALIDAGGEIAVDNGGVARVKDINSFDDELTDLTMARAVGYECLRDEEEPVIKGIPSHSDVIYHTLKKKVRYTLLLSTKGLSEKANHSQIGQRMDSLSKCPLTKQINALACAAYYSGQVKRQASSHDLTIMAVDLSSITKPDKQESCTIIQKPTEKI